MKIPKIFDPSEIRVLGALMEKEQTTPDYYPLTLNALLGACNQKSNRAPVMNLSLQDVSETLNRLSEDVLVWRLEGTRADRWRHSLDRRWELEPATKAVMTLLLVRGPQTTGEIRSRSERLHPFKSTDEVETALESLAGGDDALVVKLGRRPGQKEPRWQHLIGGEPDDSALVDHVGDGSVSYARPDRIKQLEDRVATLESKVQRLLALIE